MKARRQRDLMMAFTFLFGEFVGPGGDTPPHLSDLNGSAPVPDDPPPSTTPPTKRRVAAKTTRRPAD